MWQGGAETSLVEPVKPGPHPSRDNTALPTTGHDKTQGPPATPPFKEQRSQDGCVSMSPAYGYLSLQSGGI